MAPKGWTLAAGSAGVMLMGAPAFTTLNQPRLPSSQLPTSQAARSLEMQQASFASKATGAAAVSAACALAAGAIACRDGRKSKMACAASIISKDDQGRYRFEAPAKPIIPSEQPGVTMPLGFFDPLGFTKNPLMTFPKDPTGFKHLRSAEIKHGRVAMMAGVGSVAAHYWHFPGFENVPTGLAALNTPVGGEGFAVLFAVVGILEAASWKDTTGEPGSYGDPFNFNMFTPDMRNKEINNGRMAMFAIAGQIAAELTTGKDPVQQFGL
jgi:hypothetical protein